MVHEDSSVLHLLSTLFILPYTSSASDSRARPRRLGTPLSGNKGVDFSALLPSPPGPGPHQVTFLQPYCRWFTFMALF